MYKMNYHTDVVNFLGGRLLERSTYPERGAYFKNLTFWRGVYWRGALIREWALIRSFTVCIQTDLLLSPLVRTIDKTNL